MRWLIAAPLLLVLLVFALSNRQPVTLGLWPTGFQAVLPLSIAILIAAALAFLVGGLLVWVNELRQRRRARRAEAAMRVLEQQVQDLKGRLAAVPAPPGAG